MDEKKIAILIDADNTPYTKLKLVLQEIAAHGQIITKRAYGDWSSDHLKKWPKFINENAINPIQQFAYTTGKNSSDSAMIIDAMDLLYTNKYDAFALVSSDSDFTKLASRLKESDLFVFGVGQKKTPISFVNACDDFIFIENLKEATNAPRENIKEEKSEIINPISGRRLQVNAKEKELIELLMNANEKYSDETGWATISSAGSYLKRLDPGFDTRNYGFKKLRDLVENLSSLFEIEEPGEGQSRIAYYRIKR